jgi:threonylcarbamoyladenosine tRNA methylthiotransferase MtaB
MQAGFESRGWKTVNRASDADLVVVRGCSVTARAERDCLKFIESFKRAYPMKRLVVTGCMRMKKNEFILKDVPKNEIPTFTSRAYLKVQDGCDGKCSFCTVPRFRGAPVSVPFDETVEKARRFVEAGYHEIVVTGCNLSLYASQGKRFPELVDALASIAPEECRIRIGSVEPGPTLLETIEAMAGRPNVCRHLHLAVQSASNAILAAMRRPYKIRDVAWAAAEAKRLMPGISLGCDMICGFPGESETDHNASMAFVRRIGFVKGHVFKYSERPGTIAPGFSGQVPRDIRRKRAREMAKVIDDMRTAAAKAFVGRTVRIVVEDAQNTGGWTDGHFWCAAAAKKKDESSEHLPRPGRRAFADMKVVSVSGHSLAGECIGR